MKYLNEILEQRELVADQLQKTREAAEHFPPGSSERELVFHKGLDDLIKMMEAAESKRSIWDFSAEKRQPVLVRDGDIVIRPFNTHDIDFYWDIKVQYSEYYRVILMVEKIRKESLFLLDIFAPESIYCVIENNNESVGYLGIKDTACDPWEVAIELDGKHTHCGFGSRCIPLFLNELSRITGKTEFRATVMPDNIPSQRCFEKLGAKLIGICNDGYIRLPEEQAKFEETHMDLIDDNIRGLAGWLGVEPRKLLTHVLEYRMSCPL